MLHMRKASEAETKRSSARNVDVDIKLIPDSVASYCQYKKVTCQMLVFLSFCVERKLKNTFVLSNVV